MQLSIELYSPLVCVIHYVPILLQLRDLYIIFRHLLLSTFLQISYLRLVFCDYFVVIPFICLLKLCDFILENDAFL